MNKQKIFLATTALEEFWDKESQICFLSEGCKNYDKKEKWKKLDYFDAKYVWDSIEKKEEAFNYCFEVYDKVIEQLTIKLNQIHQIDKNKKYYETLFGAWLLRYLFQMYDKYITLKTFIETHSKFDTLVLDEDDYYIPLDYESSMKIIVNESFHLQQYSTILKILGYKFKKQHLKSCIFQESSYIKNNNKKSLLRRAFFKLQNSLNRLFSSKRIVLVNPYMNKILARVIYLFIKSKFRILLNDFAYKINFNFKIDDNLRDITIQLNDNEFEEIISKTIFQDLPVIFLEGFQEFRSQVLIKSEEIGKVDLLYTVNSLYGNELFKLYLAENNLYDKLIAHQHGNSYGVDRFVMGEKYESSLSKVFYTWGWGDGKKFKYLPSGKLHHKEIKLKQNYTNEILYVMTALPPYIYVLKPYIISSDFLYSYLKNSISFLEQITKYLNNQVLIREYFQDYKWNIKKRILDSNVDQNKLVFNNSDNIYKQIQESKVCVFDHFQTTALETLAMNKPTIVFIDFNVYGYRDSALPYFEKLINVGILHKSPESAFNLYESIKEDIKSWWQSEKVQKAREEFCYQYARTSENWADEWIKEFNAILRENERR